MATAVGIIHSLVSRKIGHVQLLCPNPRTPVIIPNVNDLKKKKIDMVSFNEIQCGWYETKSVRSTYLA